MLHTTDLGRISNTGHVEKDWSGILATWQVWWLCLTDMIIKQTAISMRHIDSGINAFLKYLSNTNIEIDKTNWFRCTICKTLEKLKCSLKFIVCNLESITDVEVLYLRDWHSGWHCCRAYLVGCSAHSHCLLFMCHFVMWIDGSMDLHKTPMKVTRDSNVGWFGSLVEHVSDLRLVCFLSCTYRYRLIAMMLIHLPSRTRSWKHEYKLLVKSMHFRPE